MRDPFGTPADISVKHLPVFCKPYPFTSAPNPKFSLDAVPTNDWEVLTTIIHRTPNDEWKLQEVAPVYANERKILVIEENVWIPPFADRRPLVEALKILFLASVDGIGSEMVVAAGGATTVGKVNSQALNPGGVEMERKGEGKGKKCDSQGLMSMKKRSLLVAKGRRWDDVSERTNLHAPHFGDDGGKMEIMNM